MVPQCDIKSQDIKKVIPFQQPWKKEASQGREEQLNKELECLIYENPDLILRTLSDFIWFINQFILAVKALKENLNHNILRLPNSG
jgi:hypothetical protein